MKKADFVMGAIALTGALSGMIATTDAVANLACTGATSQADQLTCSGTTGGFLAQEMTFSGSNGVVMGVSDATGVLGLCGMNLTGTSRYGMSTSSTVMTTKAGTGSGANSGGCT